MKAKISCALALVFVLGLLPLTMNAQEKPEKQHQLFWVYDACVKPSMNAEYYEAGKMLVAYFKKHNYPFAINTLWTSDNHVMWSVPIESFADIDKMFAFSAKTEQEAPEEMKAVEKAFNGTFNSLRICVYALDYKNSMIVKEDESESEEENFTFFDIYYFKPGTEDELNKIWQEFRALGIDKKALQSWYFYWGLMGTDSPVLWSAATAQNAIAFFEENAKMWEELGEDAGKVRQKMMKFVRKRVQKRAWFQKELSYKPAKKEQ